MKLAKHKEKIFNAPLIYLILFCFIELFGFNPDRFEDSIVIRNIVLPYIKMNITVVMATISVLAILLIVINGKKSVNDVATWLIIRIPLYFLPILFISGDYKIGVAYAVFQCFFSYFIGHNYEGELSKVIKVIALFSICIAIEVYAVIIINGISIFAPDLKWYMVIPMGRSNYIDTILIPSFMLVDLFYVHRSNPWLRLFFSIFIGGAVLATGSKLGLAVFIAYLVVESFEYFFEANKLKRSTILKGGIFILFIILILIFALTVFSDEIYGIVFRYVNNNIFENRIKVFSDSFNLIFESFLFGRSAYSYHVFDAAKAHNWILESLIQTGVAGTVVYIVCLILSIKKINNLKDKRMRRMWLFFVVFYLIHGLGEPNLFGTTSDAFFWLMIGFANCKSLAQNNKLN